MTKRTKSKKRVFCNYHKAKGESFIASHGPLGFTFTGCMHDKESFQILKTLWRRSRQNRYIWRQLDWSRFVAEAKGVFWWSTRLPRINNSVWCAYGNYSLCRPSVKKESKIVLKPKGRSNSEGNAFIWRAEKGLRTIACQSKGAQGDRNHTQIVSPR